ncbi:MAG: hypothetical protein DMF84_23780 [Acidobacteria bacterium]|nr:MAG: hypothetical protein DMF84_23780 [Acidobacteriota bacterium]
MADAHAERIARMRRAYREAHDRLVARLREAPGDLVERTPAGGGWSAAQIGWHVATVDGMFAELVSGARPSQPLPHDFRERAWTDVVAEIPQKLEASGSSLPPPEITRDEALSALVASAQKLDAALEGLAEDRGSRFGVTHKAVGTVTLAQIGDWATAHTIRHNAQAKRVLGK